MVRREYCPEGQLKDEVQTCTFEVRTSDSIMPLLNGCGAQAFIGSLASLCIRPGVQCWSLVLGRLSNLRVDPFRKAQF